MIDATIVIAAYNAEATLKRSLESAFAQTGVSTEVIVVDDASTDATVDVAQSVSDVRLERMVQNGGPAAARNRALKEASGDWIAVLDADDAMAPERIARMIDVGRSSGADVVLGNFRFVATDEAPPELDVFLPPDDPVQDADVSLETYVSRNMVRNDAPSLGYLKPLIRSEFLKRVELRYDEALRNGEDCHLIFDALAKGARVVVSMEPDYLYSIRPGSVSYRADPEDIRALIEADRRFVDRYSHQLSSRLRTLFSQRRVALTDLMESERVINAIKRRDFVRVAKLLARRPRTAWLLAARLRRYF